MLYNSRCQQSRYASRQTDSDKPLSQEERMREARERDPAAEGEDTQNIDWESCEITQGYEKKQRERQDSKLADTKLRKEAARALGCTCRCVLFKKERGKEGEMPDALHVQVDSPPSPCGMCSHCVTRCCMFVSSSVRTCHFFYLFLFARAKCRPRCRNHQVPAAAVTRG